MQAAGRTDTRNAVRFLKEMATNPKNVCLDGVKDVLGKYQLVSGEGKSLEGDRIFVRDQLRRMLLPDKDSVERCHLAAVKRVVLYVPALILLGGGALIDAPGMSYLH